MALGHERTIGSKGKPLWGIPHAQLPAKIQHVYNDLVESGKPVGGPTYRLAVGIVENWAEGHDGKGNKVSAKTQAEAAKAVAEWEKLRAKAHARTAAKGAKNVSESSIDPRLAEDARRLLAALENPAAGRRTLDRAASLAARITGTRPADHADAASALREALGDGCSGGCADAPAELAEAKKGMGKCPDCDKHVPYAMVEKGAKCPHCGKKMGGKEKVEEAAPTAPTPAHSHSRLAEGHTLRGEWDALKHPRARGGKFADKFLAVDDSEGRNRGLPKAERMRRSVDAREPYSPSHSRMGSAFGRNFGIPGPPPMSPGRPDPNWETARLKERRHEKSGVSQADRAASGGPDTIVPLTPAEKTQLDVGSALRKARRNPDLNLVELTLDDGSTMHGNVVAVLKGEGVELEGPDAETFTVPLKRIRKVEHVGG